MLAATATAPAHAQVAAPSDRSGWDAEVSATGIHAKRSGGSTDDVDSSGIGARIEAGYTHRRDDTELRVDAEAGVFDYQDIARNTRFRWGASGRVRQSIANNLTVDAVASHTENLLVLEAEEADQTALRGTLAYEPGDHRIEVYGAHRWRQYRNPTDSNGKGWQAGGRYRYRIASYHWISASIARDRINAGDARRSYRRTSLGADYSVPVARRTRVVAGIEYRSWVYPGRRVGDVPGNERRKDHLIRPEAGFAYGRSKGVFGRATVGYDFRRSNDPRFGNNGARAGLTLGYRF